MLCVSCIIFTFDRFAAACPLLQLANERTFIFAIYKWKSFQFIFSRFFEILFLQLLWRVQLSWERFLDSLLWCWYFYSMLIADGAFIQHPHSHAVMKIHYHQNMFIKWVSYWAHLTVKWFFLWILINNTLWDKRNVLLNSSITFSPWILHWSIN